MSAEELAQLAKAAEALRRYAAYMDAHSQALHYLAWAAAVPFGGFTTALIWTKLELSSLALSLLTVLLWIGIAGVVEAFYRSELAAVKVLMRAQLPEEEAERRAKLEEKASAKAGAYWLAASAILVLAIAKAKSMNLMATVIQLMVASGTLAEYLVHRSLRPSKDFLAVALMLAASSPITYMAEGPYCWLALLAALTLSYAAAGLALLIKARRKLSG